MHRSALPGCCLHRPSDRPETRGIHGRKPKLRVPPKKQTLQCTAVRCTGIALGEQCALGSGRRTCSIAKAPVPNPSPIALGSSSARSESNAPWAPGGKYVRSQKLPSPIALNIRIRRRSHGTSRSESQWTAGLEKTVEESRGFRDAVGTVAKSASKTSQSVY